jgi:hypothetical protein
MGNTLALCIIQTLSSARLYLGDVRREVSKIRKPFKKNIVNLKKDYCGSRRKAD